MLDSNKLRYSPFHDSRKDTKPGFHQGDSGTLLLATDSCGKMYLVKHTYSHNAANEYVASWLASQIGILAPHVELLTPNKKFNSPYAAAIEYFDNFTPPVETSPFYKSDIISLFALNLLINQDDNIQYGQHGNRIISIDFSECFCMTHEIMQGLLKNPDPNSRSFSIWKNYITWSFKSYLSNSCFTQSVPVNLLHMSSSEIKSEMIAVAKRVIDISDFEIDTMVHELCNLYPYDIATHYSSCIHAMQDFIKYFK